MRNKTYLPKTEDIKRSWHLIDAKSKVLGRLATQAANFLRGKGKSFYTPFIDCGDFVVIINAEKVVLTGKKIDQKIAYTHSGYPGGDKYVPYKKLMQEKPEKAIMKAVQGMLPDNKLAARQLTRLKVYKGIEHPHKAQVAEEKQK